MDETFTKPWLGMKQAKDDLAGLRSDAFTAARPSGPGVTLIYIPMFAYSVEKKNGA